MELLIVIAIIGVLASLLLVAISAAMSRARITAIKLEIDNLANAVEEYKNDRGAYPLNPTVVGSLGIQEERFMRHIRKAFPRTSFNNFAVIRDELVKATGELPPNLIVPDDTVDGVRGLNITDAANGTLRLDAAEALVFWLGGIPAWTEPSLGNFTVELTGFSLTPRNPFQSRGVQLQRTESLFEFDLDRLTDYDGDGWPEYIPPGNAASGEMPPYVYFDSSGYGMFAHYPLPGTPLVSAFGYCTPYVSSYDPTTNPMNPELWPRIWASASRFQIITSGLDGRYGSSQADPMFGPGFFPREFPSGRGYDRDQKADDDNLTNFGTGTLGDEREKARP